MKIGNLIETAGTTAVKEGVVQSIGDPYGQTKFIIEILKRVLEENGSSLEHVIRTRMFVTNIEDYEAVGKAHGEYFGEIRPASTLVGNTKLVNPEMLVEIEMTALIP